MSASAFDNIEKMEAKGRESLIKVLLAMMIVLFVIESAFAVYFIAIDELILSIPDYLIKRLFLPMILNLSLFIAAKGTNSSSSDSRKKNTVISLAMTLMCGVAAIMHSYFIPAWVVPCIGLFFCTIFHDRLLHVISTIIVVLLTVGAFIAHIYDYPDEVGLSYRYLIITMAIIILSSIVSRIMLEYSTSMFASSMSLTKDEYKYRSGFERDTLTKVSSRAILEQKGSEMISRATVINPICVAIIDIDNFKHINDTYGHENGDIVLQRLGETILTIEGNHIVVGRFGGEEFVFVFENGITDANMDNIDELRRYFSQLHFDFMDERITFSGGFYVVEEPCEYEEAVGQADKALYYSKKNGKNRITKYTVDIAED